MNWFQRAKECLSRWKAMPEGIVDEPNFTPRSRHVFDLARKEAERLNHNFVGTEHVLLGLIGLGSGVAANVLIKQGFTLEAVRAAVERSIGKGKEPLLTKPIPFTPRVKRLIKRAESEAKRFRHTYLGTEHLCLSLLAEKDGLSAQLIKDLGFDTDIAREEIEKEMAG